MKRILLVDDNLTGRQALKLFLEIQGFVIEEAENGASGLTKLATGPAVDLVISDNQMPVMTGIEFIQILSQRSFISTHPVILYTGNLTAQLKKQALELGVYAVLPKPYSFEELFTIITQAYESRKA